jgi:hypothetical protein
MGSAPWPPRPRLEAYGGQGDALRVKDRQQAIALLDLCLVLSAGVLVLMIAVGLLCGSLIRTTHQRPRQRPYSSSFHAGRVGRRPVRN